MKTMKTKVLTARIGLLVVFGLVMGACAPPAPTAAPAAAAPEATAAPAPTSAPAEVPAAVPPTEVPPLTVASVKFAGAGPVLTLDTAKSGDLVSVDVIILTQGSLVRHDAAGVPQLELAESITPSSDGMTITVKLKPNLKYSDGSPVTSTDIKMSFDRMAGGGANMPFVASIVSITVVDTLTATLQMKYPDPDIYNGLSARALALNPADKVTTDPDYFLHPVSAGPYKVVEYVPNKLFKMEENPGFINGPMVVKAIEVVNVPDLTSKVLQLATGALDFVWDLPVAAKDSLPPEVRQFTIMVGGANTLYLNMDPKGKAGTKFSDPRVRQAMSLAINRQAVADVAFAGLVKPLTSFWYDCNFCPLGMLPNGGVQDVEAAKKLMAEANVTEITADMLVSSTRGGWKEAATLVAADLAKIGVKLAVKPVDEANWNGAVAKEDFEAVYSGGASTPQATMASWFGAGYSAQKSGYDEIEGHDATIALIEKMAQETDVTKRQAIMTEIQMIGRETMPYIPIVERIALDGIRLPEGMVSIAQLTPGYIIMQTVAEQAAGKAAGTK